MFLGDVALWVPIASLVCGVILAVLAVRPSASSTPLRNHIVEILGLAFLVPVILALGAYESIPGEAITGLLGTIVGYFFGVSKK